MSALTPNVTNLTLNDSQPEVNYTYGNETLFDYVAEQVAGVLNIYYTPLLVVLGTIGNLVSVYVFYNSKLRLQSTSQYLSALALSDTLFLFQLLPPWLTAVQFTELFHKNGFCQFFVYCSYVTSCLSAWLVVAFTVERFVAVLYPLRRNAVCTVARARHIISTIAAAALLLNIPVLRFAIVTKNDCNIDYNYLEHAARFNLVDTAVSFTLPLAAIIVLNTWIMIGVWKIERARHQLIRVDQSVGGRRAARVVRCPRSQQRVTRMLLIVSTVFVVLNLPAYTMRILAYAFDLSASEYNGRWAALQQVALLFFNSNFGINFVLYCLSGQNFRRALRQALPCLRGNARRSVALRRPTGYPTQASSMSTSFVSCTEATSNCAVVSALPSAAAGAGAGGAGGAAGAGSPGASSLRRPDTFITSFTRHSRGLWASEVFAGQKPFTASACEELEQVPAEEKVPRADGGQFTRELASSVIIIRSKALSNEEPQYESSSEEEEDELY